jgi:triacylglycerol esterase/lipase EstA (alpha/beta hydrolase family)
MAWRYLPHQLNNRKFYKAVVFVHGLNGSAKSWMGAPNRFVDRLSRVPAIYNHIGLYVFGYDKKIFEDGPLWKLLARIPGYSEIAQKRKFNADLKRISTELKASLSEFLPGYKAIVLVGHAIGGLVIKRVLVDWHEPPKCYYIDTDDPHDSVLEIDDPDNHVTFQKLSALLHQVLTTQQGSPS